jgi:hypothetical protein
MEKVSNCCGASPLDTFDEVEVCPKCLEHCAYIPECEFQTISETEVSEG